MYCIHCVPADETLMKATSEASRKQCKYRTDRHNYLNIIFRLLCVDGRVSISGNTRDSFSGNPHFGFLPGHRYPEIFRGFAQTLQTHPEIVSRLDRSCFQEILYSS